MLGSNQRPPPCKGGATYFWGFPELAKPLQVAETAAQYFPDLSRHCPGLLHGCCTHAGRLRRSIASLRRGRCTCLAAPFGTSVVHVPNVHDGACLSTPTTCGDEGPRRMIRLRASPPFLTHRLYAKPHRDFGEHPFHALGGIGQE